MKHAIVLLLIVTVVVMGCATTTVIDFSNLSSVTPPSTITHVNVGDSFKVGDVLIENTSQVKLVVLPFQWGTSKYDQACPPGVIGWTPGGHVEIVQNNMSGGSGPELHFNNACLGIVAPSKATVSDLKFKFGDHGGNINLILNGTMLNYSDFKSIPPQPDVNLVVSPGLPLGTLELTGSVKQFFLKFPCPAAFPVQNYTAVVGGGQELWIDDIEFTLK